MVAEAGVYLEWSSPHDVEQAAMPEAPKPVLHQNPLRRPEHAMLAVEHDVHLHSLQWRQSRPTDHGRHCPSNQLFACTHNAEALLIIRIVTPACCQCNNTGQIYLMLLPLGQMA